MAKPELRVQARELRQTGMAVRDIAKMLHVSKSSVSLWVRDITLRSEQTEFLLERRRKLLITQNRGADANRKKHRLHREQYREMGRRRARENPTQLHLAGCMLYWAEGAKGRSRVFFVNSDPAMMRLFIRFLREEMSVPDTEFSVYVRCHPNSEPEIHRIETFWLQLLELPATALRKTQIREGGKLRKSKLSNGICGLMVLDTEIAQQIFGAIQEYAGVEHFPWLD